MEKIANKLFDYMVIHKIHPEEMREQHVYDLQILLGKTMTYGTLLLLSVFLKMWLPTIIFMITFYPLRGRTGGYHAKTFFRCLLGTICTYALLMKLVIPYVTENKIALTVITIISIPIIISLAPVDHPDLMLSEEEKESCRKSVKWLLLLLLTCIAVVEVMNISPVISACIAISIGLDAGLILTAKILVKKEVKGNEERIREGTAPDSK